MTSSRNCCMALRHLQHQRLEGGLFLRHDRLHLRLLRIGEIELVGIDNPAWSAETSLPPNMPSPRMWARFTVCDTAIAATTATSRTTARILKYLLHRFPPLRRLHVAGTLLLPCSC